MDGVRQRGGRQLRPCPGPPIRVFLPRLQPAFLHLRCRPTGAALLAVLWLFVTAAASSEQLHGLLHPDAHQASHDCVVTQLALGQVDTTAGPIPVGAPEAVFRMDPPAPAFQALPAPAGDSHSARGPPPAGLVLP
jgi:hypothetical protein